MWPRKPWSVDEKLRTYWLHRFPHQENLAVPFRSFATRKNNQNKEDQLIDYFRKLERAVRGEG